MRPSHALLLATTCSTLLPGVSRAQVEPLLGDVEGNVLIDDRPAAPVNASRAQHPPTSQPVAPERLAEIGRLIGQLTDDDFRVRDAASAKLREFGPDAIAPLEAARLRKGVEPEVAMRADALVRELRHRPSLFARVGNPSRSPFLGQRVRVTVTNGAEQTEVFDGDQNVRITEAPGRIELSVSATEDGERVTVRVRADSPDDLRRKDPDAYAVYERWGNRLNVTGGGILDIRGGVRVGPGGRIIRRGGGGPIIIRGGAGAELRGEALVIAPAGDDVAGMRRGLQRQMADANVPPAQQADVLRRLDELRDLQSAELPPVEPGGAVDDRMRAYNEKSDELRKPLADLKLPDPGDALLPPSKSRLGISLAAETPQGVTVSRVLPGSRGEKLGLKADDQILKANDKPVTSAKELRTLVTQSEKLTVEVMRDGQTLKLSEP